MNDANDKRLFWGCFLALIATAFGFFTRFAVLNEWGTQFGLNDVEKGTIGGVGVWPFAISIILFSLVIDKIGYGKAMAFAFFAHITYGILVISAPLVLAGEGATPEAIAAGKKTAYWMLYFGSFIFGLGNGTVEAVINPVVATMFSKEKTKWLNILHAGWPGGLVVAGLMTIAMGHADWRYKVGLIFLPVVVYGFVMSRCKFPVNERVASGGSYRGMLQEFGILASIIVVGLIVRQLCDVFGEFESMKFLGDWKLQLGIGAALVAAYGAYVRALGRPMLFFLMLIMIPLATTEIGTDGWITSLMEPEMKAIGHHAGWVLVYTSAIMLVLRFFAGPIVHRFSPLGLLAISAVLAATGLVCLSQTTGMMIFAAATLYGFGKTFFWPTMLGVVSEQCPKGGALTLNAVGGVGMLAVGVLGFPFIGLLQVNAVSADLKNSNPDLFKQVTEEKDGILGKYAAVNDKKVDSLVPLAADAAKVEMSVEADLEKKLKKDPTKEELKAALAEDAKYKAIIAESGFEAQKKTLDSFNGTKDAASKGALKYMAIFPCIMLVCYIALIAYFRSKGGYKAVSIH